ncbi:GntR family transcriptional regulator [Salipaludibacillus sp. CF4.18]|uniref:GntR family transcriptional regulator n=1 Tax=Salipaludibacillus sp. CF4.18 TaxID=3373081 RepID=UPI003EE67E55
MKDSFHSSQPIYRQLADRINRKILRGELKPNDKLPSVRDMAIQSNVNPNTVQRTYRELEGISIVETRRGQGTFVTENKEVLSELREYLKKEEISRFVERMHEMGYNGKEIQFGVTAFLRDEKGDTE